MPSAPQTVNRLSRAVAAPLVYFCTVVASTLQLSKLRPLAGAQAPRLAVGSLGVLSFRWPELPGWALALLVAAALVVAALAGAMFGFRDGAETKRLEYGAGLADIRTRAYRLRGIMQSLSATRWREWEQADDELEALILETRALELPRGGALRGRLPAEAPKQ